MGARVTRDGYLPDAHCGKCRSLRLKVIGHSGRWERLRCHWCDWEGVRPWKDAERCSRHDEPGCSCDMWSPADALDNLPTTEDS